MMYTFYSDKINDMLSQATNEFVSEKDMDLTSLISRNFNVYVNDKKLPKFSEFSRSFDNIYMFSTGQSSKVLKAYRTQRDINTEESRKQFKANDQPKLHDLKIDRSPFYSEFNVKIQSFLSSLKLSSWNKLNEMIAEYSNLIEELPLPGEDITDDELERLV